MSNLRDFVATQKQLAKELPLVHTSRCEFLDQLICDGQLTPRLCPVFNEHLVYLFYGRPAYRSQRGRRGGSSTTLCPVAFVFKPRTVEGKVHRVFPCDTGAMKEGRFAPFLTEADIKDITLDPTIESAQRLIPLYFESNGKYFDGKVVSGLAVPAGGTAEKWHKLLLKRGAAKYDDRKSAIEVQIQDAIVLADQLHYVILPREFLEEEHIVNAIRYEWRCDAIPYNTIDGAPPADGYPILRTKLQERLEVGLWL